MEKLTIQYLNIGLIYQAFPIHFNLAFMYIDIQQYPK